MTGPQELHGVRHLNQGGDMPDEHKPGDARVEAAAKALIAISGQGWADMEERYRDLYRSQARRVLAAADAAGPASGEAAEDGATIAGLESACGHLSALVDVTTLLLKDLRDYTNDLHENRCLGGGPERGEVPLLDRVDDWLEQRVMPAPAAPAVPDGYALVPVEPTKEMIEAAYDNVTGGGGRAAIYAAMLAAAPVSHANSPQAAAPAGWQPIETAPKDDQVVLFGQKGGRFIGRWRDYERINQPRITHWMPLPAAPTQEPQQ